MLIRPELAPDHEDNIRANHEIDILHNREVTAGCLKSDVTDLGFTEVIILQATLVKLSLPRFPVE